MLRRALRFAIERQRSSGCSSQNLSLNDDLTGLHNRRGFLLLAEQQLKVARRNKTPFLLLFLDLDRLKYINDTFGHAEGNRAIVEDCAGQGPSRPRAGPHPACSRRTSGTCRRTRGCRWGRQCRS